jgi:transposase
MINSEFLMSPLSGDAFIFFNQRRDRIKILHWQGDGFVIYCKRLERGTYEIPLKYSAQKNIEIDASTLQFILDGITLSSVRKRQRYQLKSV